MTHEKQDNEEDEDKDDSGVTVSTPFGRMRFGRQMSEGMAPYAKWLVLAISASLFVIATCYGISLIWKR